MALTPQGVYYTVPSDNYDPPSNSLTEAESLAGRIIVPVVDETERDDLASTVNPSTSEPLYVHRADAAPGFELEYTSDGINWRSVVSAPLVAKMVTDSSNQSIPDSVITKVKFSGGFEFNYGGVTSNDVDTMYAPVDGLYRISARVRWDSGSTGVHQLRIGPTSSDVWEIDTRGKESSGTGSQMTNSASNIVSLIAGNSISAWVFQNTGSPWELTTFASPYLMIELVRPT